MQIALWLCVGIKISLLAFCTVDEMLINLLLISEKISWPFERILKKIYKIIQFCVSYLKN